MSCTLGTTATCAFDDIEIISDICKKYDILLSVDASYAGPFQILEEKKYLFKGLENVDVYMLNFGK